MEKFTYFKNKYKIFNIPENVLQKIYNSYVKKDASIEEFDNKVLKYLKKKNLMDSNLILSYLDEILKSVNKVTRKQILDFCTFIEKSDYDLSSNDLEIIINKKEINNYFLMCTKDKKEINEKVIMQKSDDNATFILLFQYYCDINDIVIKEDTINLNEEEGQRVDDIINWYLKIINTIPLLNKEEEIELAKKQEAGDKEAWNTLIVSNLRLIVKYAKYYKYNLNCPILFEDLIQEGNLGLMKAVDKFDYRKGCRLSTFATYKIRQKIGRYIKNNSRSVRISVNIQKEYNRVLNMEEMLTGKLKRKPTDLELASALNISFKKLLNIKNANLPIVALNTPLKDEEESTLEDFIPSTKDTPEVEAVNSILYKDAMSLINDLSDREIDIIKRHFGLEGYDSETLQEISYNYNMTREGVRKIEAKALREIKNKLESTKKQEMFLYDLSVIGDKIDINIIMTLLHLFPKRDYELFVTYAGIDTKNSSIKPRKKLTLSKGALNYIKYIENDLRYMYMLYYKYINLDMIERDNNILNEMEKVSLRFKFSKYNYKEIQESVKTLDLDMQRVLYNSFGSNLLNIKKDNDFNPLYEEAIFDISKNLSRTIK